MFKFVVCTIIVLLSCIRPFSQYNYNNQSIMLIRSVHNAISSMYNIMIDNYAKAAKDMVTQHSIDGVV